VLLITLAVMLPLLVVTTMFMIRGESKPLLPLQGATLMYDASTGATAIDNIIVIGNSNSKTKTKTKTDPVAIAGDEANKAIELGNAEQNTQVQPHATGGNVETPGIQYELPEGRSVEVVSTVVIEHPAG